MCKMVREGFLTHEQIAWEDPADARRVIGVDPSGNKYTLSNPFPVVISDSTPGASPTNIFGSSMIASGATVVVTSFTVPTSKRFYWDGGFVGGGEQGEFSLKVGGVTRALIRNSGSSPSLLFEFPSRSAPEASATTVIEIEVKNI